MNVYVGVGPENEFISVGRTLEEAVKGIADYEGSYPGSFEFRQRSATLWLDNVAKEYGILLRIIEE